MGAQTKEETFQEAVEAADPSEDLNLLHRHLWQDVVQESGSAAAEEVMARTEPAVGETRFAMNETAVNLNQACLLLLLKTFSSFFSAMANALQERTDRPLTLQLYPTIQRSPTFKCSRSDAAGLE
jgi:hypothetical protein